MKTINGVLGVDIGGVIIGRGSDREDTSFFGPNYLLTESVTGVFESLRQLRDTGFDIFLVSKCGKTTEEKSKDWLKHHNFYRLTGVDESSVRFCRKRRDKANICEELGVTHFVDDRLEVLSYLENVSNLYLFNPDEEEVRLFDSFLSKVSRVSSWQDLTPLLLKSKIATENLETAKFPGK